MIRWLGRPISALILALVLDLAGFGCASTSTYRLPPSAADGEIHPGQLQAGELTIAAVADAQNVPSQGWDLKVQLTFDWRGQERSRVDLSRALVRVDGASWTSCHPPPEIDRDSLLLLLEPGAHTTATLACIDIAKPGRSLDLRVHATGTGAPGGSVDFRFDGVP